MCVCARKEDCDTVGGAGGGKVQIIRQWIWSWGLGLEGTVAVVVVVVGT